MIGAPAIGCLFRSEVAAGALAVFVLYADMALGQATAATSTTAGQHAEHAMHIASEALSRNQLENSLGGPYWDLPQPSS